MALSPGAISKVLTTKRCNKDNIREITRIFKSSNDRIRTLIQKILMNGARLQEKEARELQQLLRVQSKLMLMQVDPGSGSVQETLFGNECHRVTYIRKTIKEIEKRYHMEILHDL
ncbi:MAG: hypothetical protein GY849_17705 [Deltaproteobacteria bacterium]|nr:hypothetical protein [Deltaproteobacteria bacterium]